METVDALIVGGQGTFKDGNYYTEYPDRELSLEYVMNIRDIVERFRYTVVICSGGYTQKETTDLSEAKSFLNIWNETQTKPNCQIVLDEVALDSAENVIFGLMALRLRLKEREAKINRIGFYSQWHFKKPRMTSLATDLGIDRCFFFHGHAEADKANAGDKAKAGELVQLEKMKSRNDFLLRGSDWGEKREKRYRLSNPLFINRDLHLRKAFPGVFKALKDFEVTKVAELSNESQELEVHKAIENVRAKKIKALQEAFRKEVTFRADTISGCENPVYLPS